MIDSFEQYGLYTMATFCLRFEGEQYIFADILGSDGVLNEKFDPQLTTRLYCEYHAYIPHLHYSEPREDARQFVQIHDMNCFTFYTWCVNSNQIIAYYCNNDTVRVRVYQSGRLIKDLTQLRPHRLQLTRSQLSYNFCGNGYYDAVAQFLGKKHNLMLQDYINSCKLAGIDPVFPRYRYDDYPADIDLKTEDAIMGTVYND